MSIDLICILGPDIKSTTVFLPFLVFLRSFTVGIPDEAVAFSSGIGGQILRPGDLIEIQDSTRYQQQVNMQREKDSSKMTMENNRLDVEREKIAAQRDIAQTKLDIARENKNKYDVQDSKENKEDK